MKCANELKSNLREQIIINNDKLLSLIHLKQFFSTISVTEKLLKWIRLRLHEYFVQAKVKYEEKNLSKLILTQFKCDSLKSRSSSRSNPEFDALQFH